MYFQQALWWDAVTRRSNPGASNAFRYATYNFPGLGDYWRMSNQNRNLDAYMKQYGLTWADMWNTGNIPGAGQFGDSTTRYLPNARNFVSKNIADIYRDRSPGKIMRPSRRMSPELLMELQYGQRW